MRTKRLFIFAGITCIFMLSAAAAFSQAKRDHLSNKEADVVRDTQEIDKRIEVFVKAIDRRLAVLAGSTVDPAKVNNKKPQKNVDGEILDWGDLPQGTPAQLFRDIELILDEAINNIDDIATREPDSKLMMKGVKVLGAACTRLLPQLKSFSEKATAKEEKQALLNASEYAQSVIDSMGKVPANLEEKEPKDQDKDKKDKKKKP